VDRIFLDTNIIIDFLGEREGFYEAAAKIMTLADRRQIVLLISPIAFSTAYYILSKYENPLAALEKTRKLKLLCQISVIDDEVVEKALTGGFSDFEDAIQHFSALASKADVIITRNLKDFKRALLPVMDAESYLEIWRNRKPD
jgi:predicted nucleic acid-binding protein